MVKKVAGAKARVANGIARKVAEVKRERVTKDGKACAQVDEALAAQAENANNHVEKTELLAESRQWLKLGLEHDKATDSRLLRELAEKLKKKIDRRQKLDLMRARTHEKEIREVDGEAEPGREAAGD